MNDTNDWHWDTLFLQPETKTAAYELPETPGKPDPEHDDSTPESQPPVSESRALNFRDNLEYIHDWSQREMLGLLIEGVPLHDVDFDYLDHWRTNYQVPPE